MSMTAHLQTHVCRLIVHTCPVQGRKREQYEQSDKSAHTVASCAPGQHQYGQSDNRSASVGAQIRISMYTHCCSKTKKEMTVRLSSTVACRLLAPTTDLTGATSQGNANLALQQASAMFPTPGLKMVLLSAVLHALCKFCFTPIELPP